MKIATILAAVLVMSAPVAAFAANADHPYKNVNRRNDAGNNTGDSETERLNRAQLNSNGIPATSYPSSTAPTR